MLQKYPFISQEHVEPRVLTNAGEHARPILFFYQNRQQVFGRLFPFFQFNDN